MAGLITGSAATLLMAALEYLSKKNDPSEKLPLKAAVYTGLAYMFAVCCMLLLPFALIPTPLFALGGCPFFAAFVIFLFTFCVSVMRKEPFAPAFREMIFIQLRRRRRVVHDRLGRAASAWNFDVSSTKGKKKSPASERGIFSYVLPKRLLVTSLRLSSL